MHKRWISITAALFVVLFVSPAWSKVLISKVKVSGTTATDEFVELYNASATPANLLGWSLKKKTVGGTVTNLVGSFPNSLIDAFSYFLVTSKTAPTSSLSPDLTYSTSESLANNNAASLFDQSSTLIDEVAWGTISTTIGIPRPNPAANQIMLWLPEPTPTSTENASPTDAPTTTTTTDDAPTSTTTETPPDNWSAIKINEIMPNPDDGNEWVELYNAGTVDIDLANGTLCDNRAAKCTIADLTGIIPAHSFTTFYLKTNYLNNTGDSVILKDPNNTIVDHIDYGSSPKAPASGQSIARRDDDTNSDQPSDWVITLSPTPNEKNVITLPPPPPLPYSFSSGITPEKSLTPVTPKTTATETKNKPAPIELTWKLTVPTFAIVGRPELFRVTKVADPRGGTVFSIWRFTTDTIIEGNTVTYTFTTSGTHLIAVNGTSTAGTPGQKQFSLNVFAPPKDNTIQLTEIFSTAKDKDDNFIELYNSTPSSTNIGSWRLTTSNDSFVIPPNTTLAAYSYSVFSRLATSLITHTDNETIGLWNASGTLIENVLITSTSPRHSYIRTPLGWQWNATATPGFPPELIPQILGEKITATSSKKTSTKTKITTSIAQTSWGALPLGLARHKPKGTPLMLTGQITVPPGVMSDHYLYIADETGGLEIYNSKNFSTLTTGDIIRVTGKMSALQGRPRLNLAKNNLQKIATTTPSTPTLFTLQDITTNTLGQLITVTAEVTELKGSDAYLGDSVSELRVRLPATFKKTELKIGDTLQVTGILETTPTGDMLIPRNLNDLIRSIKSSSISNTTTTHQPYLPIMTIGVGFIGIALLWRTYKKKS